MKKVFCLLLGLLLCTSLLAGCRSQKKPAETVRPTTMPTVPTTLPETAPTTETTMPTTGTTPSETVDRGNGPADPTDTTAATTPESRGRTVNPMPRSK